ncbi:MAG: bifunctional folylpolyglutamate synthase/dihydrofolate synthase [Clostridiales bacterium]|nr:bifunctional folylpolyglutamate synthase/dihydrofolate synthase [Clostridiales bacterium]
MTYDEALSYIWGTPSPSSDRVIILERLLSELDNPHMGMKYVHIAGTNGKGSTANFISGILRCAGYKTGLYTSPHLSRINERIAINGETISDQEFAAITAQVASAVGRLEADGYQRPTIFGLITAVGYLYFKRKQCDIVILETGMGGRLDATNVIEGTEVSVITNIGLDHTEYLGNTPELIAAEKAGIIKKGGTVVLYRQSEAVMNVIKDACRKSGAQLLIADGRTADIKSLTTDGAVFDFGGYENLRISLAGRYQVDNAAAAITAAEVLRQKGYAIDGLCIRQGLKTAFWPGRFELIRKEPTVIVDGTHNPQGAGALTESLELLFSGKKIIFVLGALAGKDYKGSIERTLPLAKSFYTITADSDRALNANLLAEEIGRHSGIAVKAFQTIPAALDEIMAHASIEDVICIFGTLYQVSEVRSYFGSNGDTQQHDL